MSRLNKTHRTADGSKKSIISPGRCSTTEGAAHPASTGSNSESSEFEKDLTLIANIFAIISYPSAIVGGVIALSMIYDQQGAHHTEISNQSPIGILSMEAPRDSEAPKKTPIQEVEFAVEFNIPPSMYEDPIKRPGPLSDPGGKGKIQPPPSKEAKSPRYFPKAPRKPLTQFRMARREICRISMRNISWELVRLWDAHNNKTELITELGRTKTELQEVLTYRPKRKTNNAMVTSAFKNMSAAARYELNAIVRTERELRRSKPTKIRVILLRLEDQCENT